MASKKVYFAPYSKFSFEVPVIGENGKPIMVMHPITGAVTLQRGKPMYEKVTKHFSLVCGLVSKGLACMYETDDPHEIEVLDKMVAAPDIGVMTVDQWEKYRNPQVFDAKQETKKLQTTLAEKENVIKEMQAKLEQLSRPMNSGSNNNRQGGSGPR